MPGPVSRFFRAKGIFFLIAASGFGFFLGLAVAAFRLPPYDAIGDIYRSVFGVSKPVQPHSGFRRTTRIDETVNPSLAQEEELQRLIALGYVAGVQPQSDSKGVATFDEARCAPGINLMSIGHRPEARLVTMKGETLHRWTRSLLDSFPNEQAALDTVPGARHWRRVHLLPDGELFAIHEGIGLIKIDRNSELIWAQRNGAHHDLEVLDDGRLYLLTRKPEMVPWFDDEKPISNEFVDLLEPDGTRIRRISLMDAIRDSDYGNLLERREHLLAGDPLHSNEIEVLDGTLAESLPAFRQGNLLISLLKIGFIVLDFESGKVVWAWSGLSLNNHHSTILPNGHLLCFDNLGDGGSSRVLELDLVALRATWRYDNSMGFLFSETCGANQRLPNGNTLITESDRGRAIEVTKDGETVWEYLSPESAGVDGEFVARLFEVIRIPKPPWL